MTKPDNPLRATRGFTLLELLVAILIIGLLVGIVGPKLTNQLAKSEVTAARAQLAAIDKALMAYRIDMGTFPTSQQGLTALVTAPQDVDRWRGPYLQAGLPVDPWGQPYVYRSPAEGREYELFSTGRDRQPGGAGDGADIVLP